MLINRWSERLLIVGCLLLGACASAPDPVPQIPVLFRDGAFKPQTNARLETRDDVFALDPALEQQLQALTLQGKSTEQRLKILLAHIYTDTGIRLSYASGHSTGAAQTWANKQGDCLSLTILAYAAAQALDITAHMQEVPGPAVVDRRGQIDFVNGHVNLHVPARSKISLGERVFESGGFIVDFQPHSALRNLGRRLEEREIMARFYNNRASEYLAHGQDDLAYRYFRTAGDADMRYAPIFSNLAVLYGRKRMDAEAEAALRYAVALKGNSDVALKGLHQLLQSQGRLDEAQVIAQELQQWQDASPYYWLERGKADLLAGQAARAVDALERAQALANGFADLHYHLALAYARSGQADKAQAQQALLRSLVGDNPALALLGKKIRQ